MIFRDFFRKNYNKKWVYLTLTLLFCSSSVFANLSQTSEVQQFVQSMSQKYGFNKNTLQLWFSSIQVDYKIIEAMSRPAEAKPWSFYRQHLVSAKRIQEGQVFWKKHAKALKRAEKQFGVPANIIVAIIGIESNYGQKMGSFPVLQTLATLAFHYPRRATFFKSELEQFLVLCNTRKWDPRTILGSYCGAIGQPQFMPSSYRSYAIDFNQTHHSNLIHNTEDAIASVANFLKSHGWKENQPIVYAASYRGTISLPTDKSFTQVKPTLSLKTLSQFGIQPLSPTQISSDTARFSLFTLTDDNKIKYWLGGHNFYMITRYNHSINYAMAVVALGKAIQNLHQKSYLKPPGVSS